jgi:hypothetical protein
MNDDEWGGLSKQWLVSNKHYGCFLKCGYQAINLNGNCPYKIIKTIHFGVPAFMETTIFLHQFGSILIRGFFVSCPYTWDISGLCYLTSMGYILVAEITRRFCCNTSGVHRESSNVQMFDDYGNMFKSNLQNGNFVKPVRLIFRKSHFLEACESHCEVYRCRWSSRTCMTWHRC